MAQRIVYCEVCKSSSNIWRYSICNTCQSRGNNYIRESDHQSEIEAKNSEISAKDPEILNLKSSQSEMIVKEILENLRETKNSEISAKDFGIQNLKSEMSHSEMKAKEELENLRESSTPKKILSM